jgi:hypothetical protein
MLRQNSSTAYSHTNQNSGAESKGRIKITKYRPAGILMGGSYLI